MTSVVTIAIGVALLTISLATGHPNHFLVNWASFVLGSILVIAGTGKLLFVDD
jgi:hypothetical protein